MYYYIFNPAAAENRTKGVRDKIRQKLKELGIEGTWSTTTTTGEAAKLTASAILSGHTTIVAIGGDDIVNEVINGVRDSGIAIGIIPLGKSNRLSHQLGITNWQQACDLLAARRLTSYGLIAAGQNFFLSTLTIGFETHLDVATDTSPKGIRAKASQLVGSYGRARKYNILDAHIKIDDSISMNAKVFSLSVFNQKFINPLLENKLVLSLSDRPNQKQIGGYLWQLMHTGSSPIDEVASTRILANRIVIETTPSTGIMLDGKLGGRTPVAIRLTDRRVRFITDKTTPTLR